MIRVLTLNVNGVTKDHPRDIDAILDDIYKLEDLDVLLIQEYTDSTYEKLVRELKNNLSMFRYTPKQLPDLKLGIFSKHKIKDSELTLFTESRQGRGLLRISIQLENSLRLNFLTTQVEMTREGRGKQEKQIEGVLKNMLVHRPCIFGGDLAIPDYRLNRVSLPDGITDTWYEAGSDENKYTADSETNTRVRKPYRDRPDRVYFLDSEELSLKCVSHELFKTRSRRYGVLATFEFS